MCAKEKQFTMFLLLVEDVLFNAKEDEGRRKRTLWKLVLSYVAFVTVVFSATKTGDLRTKGVPKKKEIYIIYYI